MASKAALQSLRRKPQFIDAVFAAKTERTKMEEEPVQAAPDIEQKDDFIITREVETQPVDVQETTGTPTGNNRRKADNTAKKNEKDEFDLSDIKAFSEKMTKEYIVAAAEAAAFGEK